MVSREEKRRRRELEKKELELRKRGLETRPGQIRKYKRTREGTDFKKLEAERERRIKLERKEDERRWRQYDEEEKLFRKQEETERKRIEKEEKRLVEEEKRRKKLERKRNLEITMKQYGAKSTRAPSHPTPEPKPYISTVRTVGRKIKKIPFRKAGRTIKRYATMKIPPQRVPTTIPSQSVIRRAGRGVKKFGKWAKGVKVEEWLSGVMVAHRLITTLAITLATLAFFTYVLHFEKFGVYISGIVFLILCYFFFVTTKTDKADAWIYIRAILIGIIVYSMCHFGYIAYQGYKLGDLSGTGLITTVICGLILLFVLFRFLSKKGRTPKSVGGYLKLFLIIILVIAAIYGLWYMNKVGFLKKGEVTFEKINLIDRIKMTFSSMKEKLTSYVYGYGKWTAPEVIERGKPVGVDIESFKPRRDYFRIDKDEIYTIAVVKVYGLPDRKVNVRFDCDMEGISPKEVLVSGAPIGQQQITLQIGQEFGIYQVMCRFDPVKEIPKEETTIKRVDLTAKYIDFATISKLKVYTMNKEELERIEFAGENPFKMYDIEDPLLTKERTTISVQDTNSPVELWLNLPLMQPLTTDMPYILGYKLKHNKVKWGGEVDAIHEVRFAEFPKYFKTTVKIESLDKMNEQMKKGELSTDTGYIDFIITKADSGLNYDVIKAVTTYDYIYKDSTTIEIVEEKDF